MVARLAMIGWAGCGGGSRQLAGMRLCLALGKQATIRVQRKAWFAWGIGDVTQHAAARNQAWWRRFPGWMLTGWREGLRRVAPRRPVMVRTAPLLSSG